MNLQHIKDHLKVECKNAKTRSMAGLYNFDQNIKLGLNYS